MSSTKLMMMMANGKMMTPINQKVQMPDISAPGSVILYQRRRSQRMATERKRPKRLRQDAAKGLFRRSGDTETEEGKSSTQKKEKPE